MVLKKTIEIVDNQEMTVLPIVEFEFRARNFYVTWPSCRKEILQEDAIGEPGSRKRR